MDLERQVRSQDPGPKCETSHSLWSSETRINNLCQMRFVNPCILRNRALSFQSFLTEISQRSIPENIRIFKCLYGWNVLFFHHCLLLASPWYWGLIVMFSYFPKRDQGLEIHINQSEQDMMCSSPKQHNTNSSVCSSSSSCRKSKEEHKILYRWSLHFVRTVWFSWWWKLQGFPILRRSYLSVNFHRDSTWRKIM